LAERFFEAYQPDAAFVLFTADNDYQDNRVNSRYGYYKPYFTVDDGQLILRGIPVPKCLFYYFSAHPAWFKSALVTKLSGIWIRWRHPLIITPVDPTAAILRQFKSDVEARHAKFFVGFNAWGPAQQALCRQEALQCLDLGGLPRFPAIGHHWTVEGHRLAAQRVAEWLKGRM